MTKSPDPTDKHVGARVRMRRMQLGKSQTDLASALGLTFQQVQKYEKGANRIGAGRLEHIANILRAPVAFFYEGRPDQNFAEVGETIPDYSGFLATREGLDLVANFTAIANPGLRTAIVRMIEAAAHPGKVITTKRAA